MWVFHLKAVEIRYKMHRLRQVRRKVEVRRDLFGLDLAGILKPSTLRGYIVRFKLWSV